MTDSGCRLTRALSALKGATAVEDVALLVIAPQHLDLGTEGVAVDLYFFNSFQRNENASASIKAACLLSAAAPWPPSMFS